MSRNAMLHVVVRLRVLIACALCGVLLSACASNDAGPPPVEDRYVTFTVEAAEDVNPNEGSNPSPIQVWVYELSDTAAFMQADYFNIVDDDEQLLGDDILEKTQFILRPGESKLFNRKAKRDAVAIAVVGGYRQLDQATWRATYALPSLRDESFFRRADRIVFRIVLQSQSVVVEQQAD